MSNEKEEKKEEVKQPPKMRQILIETDGTNINLVKNETVGSLELVAVLGTILNKLNQPQPK